MKEVYDLCNSHKKKADFDQLYNQQAAISLTCRSK